VAYARVLGSSTNANDWVVVVPSPPIAISLAAGLDTGTILMLTASLILMILAVASARGRRRDLQLAATTDALTGLPNRALFADRVDQALLRCRRDGSTAAVLLIDLNGFKEVNDTLGHSHGDALLRSVGQRLAESVRESDTIARLGGDEFGLLLHNSSGQAGAIRAAESVASALSEPIVSANIPVRISASVGIAIYPHHGDDVADLVQHADVAMYAAKGEKIPFTVYSPARDPFSRERLGLLADLPRAIEERELTLHYQPKIDLADMRVTGVEALVRWPHPNLGLILPAEFVPLAEETGMIDSLTSLVLDMALEQLRAWWSDGLTLGVAANITGRSLVDAHFPSEVATSLRKWGLPASVLTLELTESAFVSDPERAISTASELREMGVAISIDDFGSGYSSLSYLRDLPVDELKIDRSFISKMLHSDSDALIVRSAIVLAHGLGLRVVAEGVEQIAELDELGRFGCDIAQGYLFSKPLPHGQLTPLLHDPALLPGVGAPAP
jgi:diguanylate cyclase (GGDEF)-like protein